MKKDLKKEILKYTSAAAAVLGGTAANGQYQYTDIPDTTINTNNGFYNLDLDQDGNMDFTITQYVDTGALGSTNAVLIQPYTNTINFIAGEQISQYNYPFNLQAGAVIDGSTPWNGAGGQFTTGYMAFVVDGQSYPNSNWVGPTEDGYLGLTIWKNNLPHYGWARLDVGDSSESFTVKDFSVNLTVDSSIVVGAELLGEMENLLEGVSFYVADGKIIFNKPASIEELHFRLLDLSGKMIQEADVREERAEIALKELPSSVYILEMQSDALVRSEKLFIY